MNRALLILTGAVGALLALGGGVLLLMYALWPVLAERALDGPVLSTPDQGVASVAQWAALGTFGLGLGLALLWHVRRGWEDRRSAGFRVAPLLTGLALLGFPLVLLAGVTVLAWAQAPRGYLFPLSHLLAIAVPGLVALGLAERAGRSRPAPPPAVAPGGLAGRDSRIDRYGEPLAQAVVGPPSWRRVVGSLGWGLTGGALLSMVLEVLALVAGVMAAAVILALVGQGATIEDWLSTMPADGDVTGMLDTAGARELLANPLVVAGLVFAVGVVVPVIEELAKSLAIVLLRARLTMPRDGFLYGVAAGVGFGMFENIFYNVESLDEWWTVASLRFGAILMHALASGLMGLGWYYGLRRRDWRRFSWLALASFAVHGLWNGSQVVIIAISAQWGNSLDLVAMIQEGNPGGWVLLGWTVSLSLLAAALLVVLPRRLARAGRVTPLSRPAAPYHPAPAPSHIVQ
jgi:RsiW-degrading membrane proteinase PrsW (M82 family)